MVTLAQVAQRANVTAATVSNVLRNPQKVKPATVERVMAAIRELGYRPNLTARALAEGRTSTLALMLSNITNPFYPEFVLAAEREARKRGHYLLVSNTDDDPAITRNYLERIAGTLAAGAIVSSLSACPRRPYLRRTPRRSSAQAAVGSHEVSSLSPGIGVMGAASRAAGLRRAR